MGIWQDIDRILKKYLPPKKDLWKKGKSSTQETVPFQRATVMVPTGASSWKPSEDLKIWSKGFENHPNLQIWKPPKKTPFKLPRFRSIFQAPHWYPLSGFGDREWNWALKDKMMCLKVVYPIIYMVARWLALGFLNHQL